ncbi:MAG: DNA polymerase [Parvularcula sp.]|jgi:DNA polymerase-1|nr:DNA polymerase [Parvularcula sp.]
MHIPDEAFQNHLQAAVHYRDACGWIVHPLHGPNEGTEKERGKKPKLRGWKKLEFFDCDDAFLRKHFEGDSPANVGVVVQPPHIVIDLDSKKDGGESVRSWLAKHPSLAKWPRERTAGGCHLHLRCEDVPPEAMDSAGRNQKLSATVADGVTAEVFLGGNVVVAPSVHKTGHHYEWEVTGDVPSVPWAELTAIFFSNQPLEDRKPKARGRPKREPPYWARYGGDLKTLDLIALAKHLRIYGQPISGEEGKHSIRCPWRDQHSDCATHWTPGDSSAVIWKGKPGHFPNFFCSHTSHGEKTLADLLAWAETRERGVVDRFCRQQRVWEPGQSGEQNRRRVLLPNIDRPDSEFADEVGTCLSDKAHWFNKSSLVVEVRKIQGEGILFMPLKPAAGVTSLEKHVEPGVLVKTESFGDEVAFEFKAKSMSQAQASILLEAEQLKCKLPPVERMFHVPLPILREDGYIITPKKGYDPDFRSWLELDAPDLREMSLDEAKAWIRELLKEFCFRDEQALTHAIAAVLTPFCRGLYPRWTCRTPVFIYEANRPRSGKDYLAGNIALIHEGRDIEDAPIPRDSQELRKKITSTLISGRRRIHFANCRGFLSSDVLENITTSEQWADRLLGYNQEVTLGNELEFSLSGNIGLTYTPDFANRTRKIALAFYEEDANKRQFKRSDLKQWTRDHRADLLSALMTFVIEWQRQGRPKAPTVFTSFPAWAEVVGGIMHACGLGDPCLKDNDEEGGLTGDTETRDMRALFDAAYQAYPEKWIPRSDIYAIVQDEEDTDWFHWIDLETRSGQTKFGNLLGKFVGRQLGDVRMLWDENEKRARRRKFKFTKNDEVRVFEQRDFDGHFGDSPSDVSEVTENVPSADVRPSESTESLATLATLASPATGRNMEVKIQSRVLEREGEKKNEKGNLYAYVNSGGREAKAAKVAKASWELVSDPACFDDIAEEIAVADHPVALDIETFGQDALNPYRGEIRLLSLALPWREPWIIDLQATGYDLGPLKGVLETAELVIHNARFDLSFLRRHCGLRPRKLICTLTAARLLSAGTREPNSLGEVLRRYGIADLPKVLGDSDWGGLLFDDQYAYAASDVIHLHALRDRLEAEIEAAAMGDVWTLETELTPVVVEMEAAGFAMDRRRLESIREEHRAKASQLGTQVQEALEQTFNPGSPDQLRKALETAGIRVKSTAEAVLAEVAHPAAKLTLEMRSAEKVAQQAQSLLDAIETDGRIHGQFDPTGTEAGRFSAKRPNLQNVGRGSLRECFIATEGRKLVCADYSQIELRVAAALAGETRMIEAYKAGADLHRQTAALVLNKDPETVTKDDRQLAKAVNFGLLYGQTAPGLVRYAKTSYGVTLTEQEAERIRRRFFRAYEGLARWHAQTRRLASDNLKETRTRMGRRRLLSPGEKFFWQRFSGSLNTPVQGGAADGLKRAIVRLASRLPEDAWIVSTVHDELIVDCPAEQADAVAREMEASMKAAMSELYPEVPVEVEANIGENWATAK